MDFCLLVITDGRQQCLEETVAAATEFLPEPKHKLLVNDAQKRSFSRHITRRFKDFEILDLPTKAGFAGAIQAGWRRIVQLDSPFVFHLEDDFVIKERIPLLAMAWVLYRRPHIQQILLKRQPCNAQEKAAGGFIEMAPEAYSEHSLIQEGNNTPNGVSQWCEHRRFFSTNPSIYRSSLCRLGWPDPPQSEARFSDYLFGLDPKFVSAYWGRKFDPPKVEHIGRFRVGIGY